MVQKTLPTLWEVTKNEVVSRRFWKWEKSWLDQWLCVSAIVKNIRVWNPLMSLYYTHCMLHAWWKRWRDYLLKRLAIEASETFFDNESKNIVNSINQIYWNSTFWETDWVYHLVLMMSSRWKWINELKPFTAWFQSRLGILFECYWTYLEWFVPKVFNWTKKAPNIASYIKDQHTASWSGYVKKWLVIDNRFSWSTNWRRRNLEIFLSNCNENLEVFELDTNKCFPLWEDKKSYDNFQEWENIDYKYFPKNIKEINYYLDLPFDEFKKFIFDVIKELENLWYYDKSVE